jgi:hypothetical protein
MEDGVDGERKESKRYLSRIKPDQAYDCEVFISPFSIFAPINDVRTEILHVLIREKLDRSRAYLGTWFHAGAISLEDNDTVCCNSRNESQSVGDLRPGRFGVEGNVGETVTEDRQ